MRTGTRLYINIFSLSLSHDANVHWSYSTYLGYEETLLNALSFRKNVNPKCPTRSRSLFFSTKIYLCLIVQNSTIGTSKVCEVHWNVVVQVSEFCLGIPHGVSGLLGLFCEGRSSASEAAGLDRRSDKAIWGRKPWEDSKKGFSQKSDFRNA